MRLWCQYLSDVVEVLDYSDAKTRDLFEQGLSEVGLHVTQGGQLWEQYRQVILFRILSYIFCLVDIMLKAMKTHLHEDSGFIIYFNYLYNYFSSTKRHCTTR